MILAATVPGSIGYMLCSHLVADALQGQTVDQLQIMRFQFEGWLVWAVGCGLPVHLAQPSGAENP